MRVLILSRSELHRDPRIQRQITALKPDYEVVGSGLSDPGRRGVEFVPMKPSSYRMSWLAANAWRFLRGWRHSDYFRVPWVQSAVDALEDEPFDLVLANDILTLPLAVHVAAGRPVVFDAHEYSPGELPRWHPRYWLVARHDRSLLRELKPHVSEFMTVGEGIADLYERDQGWRPHVVPNLPARSNSGVMAVDPSSIRLVHHGKASRDRRLQVLVRAMKHLGPSHRLTLYLTNPPSDRRRRRLDRMAERVGRIEILDAVPMERIVDTLRTFDIGIHLLKPDTPNNRHAMPNKLFEFVHARLAVVVGPGGAMADFVRRHDVGVVTSDYSARALAASINSLSVDEITRYKRRSDELAPTVGADTAVAAIRSIVDRAASSARNGRV